MNSLEKCQLLGTVNQVVLVLHNKTLNSLILSTRANNRKQVNFSHTKQLEPTCSRHASTAVGVDSAPATPTVATPLVVATTTVVTMVTRVRRPARAAVSSSVTPSHSLVF